ncbi:27272_t:CDS:2 [Dentiscutata erythropus]|uniref:27272_t:CDS:1 n=1 Tax=Dentiscutata erythropus TaxID=1348616 RepID=A0A9N8V6G1_9GLOM|nr:27272_t:CDS:2 [Dentiscutata erythropus]
MFKAALIMDSHFDKCKKLIGIQDFKMLKLTYSLTEFQSLKKLILQGIKFDKDNLANIAPNLEILSIKNSFGNLFEEGKNKLHNLQRLKLENNEIELNRIVLKAKCESLKFFKIKERELSNEVKEEFILLLSQNYPNITTLWYITDNLIFSSTLKIFKKLYQLQIEGFAYYDLPYSNQDYFQALVKYLPNSLKILNLLNIDDYSHENLNCFLQDFDIERVKLEVLILLFNIELDLLPNLKEFVEKAKHLRYIEIFRSENYNTKKQKDSEREIIDICRVRNVKYILNYQFEIYKDYFDTYEIDQFFQKKFFNMLKKANCKKILDCFSIADAIMNITKEAKKPLNFHPKVTVILPTNVSGKARTDSANYVAKKRKVFDQLGIPMHLIKISPQYNESRIKELIKDQSNDSSNTGIMLQLLFPSGFSVNKSNILNTIPIHKDIDGLTIDSVGNLFDLNKDIKPATPLGICSIFDYYNIPTEGKHIVIMGKGQLVGQPLACMLMSPPYNATVTICDIYTENIKTITKSADILIVAIGKALHVNDEFVKPGVIVIDVGINRLPQNVNGNINIVDDVDHSVYEICKYYTPVPTGVGLLIVAFLAFNTINTSILQHRLPPLNLSQIIRQNYSVEKIKVDKKEYKKKLNLLLLSSAYNGLTQRINRELLRLEHTVTFQTANSDDTMCTAFVKYKPDLIICPMLIKAILEDIYTKVKCLIVHPGIKGDRGPSSLDWAIIDKKDEWGVTVLETDEEMDAGAIWASENFLVPKFITKTHLYNSCVINTASKLGQLYETIKKTHSIRQINWETDTTEIILRKICAADSQPGVKAEIDLNEHKITRLLYGAHNEKKINKDLTVYPGKILAKRDDAICIATKDSALWVSQLHSLKSKINLYPFKLPAIIQLGELSNNIPEINNKQILTIPTADNFQEISFELFGSYGILHFDFYNGAMSTSQCKRLLKAIKQCQKMPIKGLILAGSANNWSNGINLNVIQHAINPSIEGWKNIKAINEVVKEIIKITNIITVAAVQANAGAGGVYLALATNFLFVKQGIVLNPHYKNMSLYGSELHTYTAPKRIGTYILNQLKDNANPILDIKAIEIGLFDSIAQQVQMNPGQSFLDNVKGFIKAFISDTAKFMKFIKNKQDIRMQDESEKSLDEYEKDELEEMQKDLFENRNNFHEKR